MAKVSQILLADETIVWSGRPNHTVLIIGTVMVILLSFPIAALVKFIGGPGVIAYISIIPLALWHYISSRLTIYFITTKRVLIESGIIGRDFKSIYFEQVRSSEAKVTPIDKLFGTGSISLDTGRVKELKGGGTRPDPDSIDSIDAPYEVYQTLQVQLRAYKETLFK